MPKKLLWTEAQDAQISNIPGIPYPVYLAGAEITHFWPFAPVPGCGMMIATPAFSSAANFRCRPVHRLHFVILRPARGMGEQELLYHTRRLEFTGERFLDDCMARLTPQLRDERDAARERRRPSTAARQK